MRVTSSALALPAPSRVESREPVVELEGLTKRYPVRRPWADLLLHPRRRAFVTAVDRVSCSIGRGEFFGLLGPNGAGKTTLFKMLSTLVTPDGGNAIVAGFNLLQHPARVRSAVSPVIADERSLNWRVSASENLRFYAALYGLRGSVRDRRVEELIDLVGLTRAGPKLVGAFSSGMKQRLLLARALLPRPAVLLLDEPTRSLDPLAARRFRTFLKEEIGARQQCAVFLATHSTEEALELCDRVAVLDRGRLIAMDTPQGLSSRLAGQRYKLETLGSVQQAVQVLERCRWDSRIAIRNGPEDRPIVEVEIEGEEQAAQVLAALVIHGVEVVSFDKMHLPLADVIERLLTPGME